MIFSEKLLQELDWITLVYFNSPASPQLNYPQQRKTVRDIGARARPRFMIAHYPFRYSGAEA
ncbi:hypothetical protein [Methylocystis sp. ATCC 49242]|uniref:hypothetical protein n=1 Tax=Methylocystis sp. ATCC 49242 TaxID=622637 RepID=UPI0002EF898A|nr:hypothetical protein [Methylocystis sp. ATCC 49242]